MKNKKGFTLIELLAVIVVLAIVMVLAVTTVLPYMNTARENAFRIEATSLVKAANTAKELNAFGHIKVSDTGTASCINENRICFTVDELIELDVYDTDSDSYAGKVEIDLDSGTPTLYIKKGDEFKIIGGTKKDYTSNPKKDDLSTTTWSEDYEKCVCSNN